MIEPGFRHVEGSGHDEDRRAPLPRHDPPRRKAPAVPKALDLEQDRLLGIAPEQEIGVQRVRVAAGDRTFGGDQGLGQHLAAKHPPPAVVRRNAGEPVLPRRREIEQGDKVVGGHEAKVPVFARC